MTSAFALSVTVGALYLFRFPIRLEEFKQQATSYTAEYGGSATQFNLSTKSGSNSLHGTVFEFNRNNAYDARAFFDPPTLPPLRQNNYGYSAGGPVYIPKIYNGKNHSFFFANFERLIATTSATVYPLGPDANALQGVIASAVPVLDPSTGEPFLQDENGNYLIPTNRWSRLATVSTAAPGRYFPIPGPMQNGGNSVVTISSPTDQRQQTYRFDQTLSSKDQMFARFTLTNFANTSDGDVALANSVSAIKTHSWVVNETHTFKSNLVNQAMLGWLGYLDTGSGISAPSADISGLGLQNIFNPARASFPALQFSLLSQFGGANNVPGITSEGVWDFSDTLSWLHGRHNITTGFSGFRDLNASTTGGNPLGVYDFDGTATAPSGTTPTVGNVFADFLLGDIVSGNASVPTPYSPDHPFEDYPELNKFAIFVNDNWKVSDRLNVNIGLRYDYQGIPHEKNNHWFWRDVGVPGGALCVADDSLITSGVGGAIYKWCGRTDSNDSLKKPFAPRVGLDFRPFSSDNTMVRAGYGIFYDQYQMAEYFSGGFYPYAEVYSLTHQSFDSLFPTIPPATPVTGADLGFVAVLATPVQKDPYLQTWSLSVQQALLSNTKVDIAYVGSRGSHLGTRVTASQPTSYDPSDPGAGYPLYNFGTFGQDGTPFAPGRVLEGNFETKSNYNSLQISVDHRSKDAAILVSYTWASAMDTASSQAGTGLDYDWAGPMDTYDIDRDYSKSAFDVPQRLVASFVYQLPFGRGEHFASTVNRATDALIGGWQVNGIYEAQGGTPETVYGADLDTALQAVTQRSNQIASPYPSGFHKSYKEWFDVDSFTQPAVGVFGTTRRNSIRAPGLNDFDTSVFKNFPLFERMSFQLRLEAFNALNHTQFGAPGYAVPGSPSLATINTTIVPGRILQLGGKIIF